MNLSCECSQNHKIHVFYCSIIYIVPVNYLLTGEHDDVFVSVFKVPVFQSVVKSKSNVIKL